jgi:hypothetical protein
VSTPKIWKATLWLDSNRECTPPSRVWKVADVTPLVPFILAPQGQGTFLFTSKIAVEIFDQFAWQNASAAVKHLWKHKFHWGAVGPGTAQKLKEDFHLTQVMEPSPKVGLLALLCRLKELKSPLPWMVFTSQDGLSESKRELFLTQNPEVSPDAITLVPVYQVRPSRVAIPQELQEHLFSDSHLVIQCQSQKMKQFAQLLLDNLQKTTGKRLTASLQWQSE